MNRKFFIALLGVALFMGAPLAAAVMEYTGTDGVTPVKVKAATPLPITTTTPLEVSNPGVATSALYAADLATDTPTLLSDVVTLATNDIVEIQVSAASWRGPAGTASGTLQTDGIKMSANDNPWSFRFNGVDYAFIADPAAVSRLRVFVHKDR